MRMTPLPSPVRCLTTLWTWATQGVSAILIGPGAYRERLLSYMAPGIYDLAVLLAFSVGVFLIGGLFFRHLKRGFADVL